MSFPRSSGILLHPTSLPGQFGIGDLGHQAYRFIDFLAETKQQIWQILPLGPTGHGNSPYMCYSAMAGNPLLISLETLAAHGFLTEADLHIDEPFSEQWVDYDRAVPFKLARLQKAAQGFKTKALPETQTAFAEFCQSHSSWLEDYALFMALKDAHGGVSWAEWPPEIAGRQPEVLAQQRLALSDSIFLHKYMQFEFCRQWFSLKNYANEKGIQILGDMPIYVAHDSADVWAFPENFRLDPETLLPAEMAGVPPDFFSETGQLWGNPTYHWENLAETGFSWWLQRVKVTLVYVDMIRIDHFRGFESYWAVPAGEETAINGEWIEAPGTALFEKIESELGHLPFLAEDLGVITPAVEALRNRFDFPGMKILQFAFGDDHRNPYLPFNIDRNFAIYPGTHDNDTTVGWFHSTSDYTRDRLSNYVGGLVTAETVHWVMIRLALSSVANQAIIQLQDLLGLDTQARMNTPGEPENNWQWRFQSAFLTPTLREQLTLLTELYGRALGQWQTEIPTQD